MNNRTKIITTAFTGAVLMAGLGVGVAAADPQTPTPGSSPSEAAPSHKADKKDGQDTGKKGKALQARALHGEAVVGGKKKHRVLTFQRGTVEKITGTAITVKSVDGFSATYAINDQTNVRKSKDKAQISDVHTQDKVRIRGIKDGSTTTAKAIHDRGDR